MVTGEWTGTMNLTEPHAGSDLGALKTKAVKQADGTYRIFGTKIFITYGDHEMTDNIIHLVLARLPDAPPGTRGISLFLVPKYLVNKDGSLGARNDVVCAGLEHKLGIHASPTCVMKYGEKDGAVGYLVGEENRGLNVMFIMMNAARLAVGMQGVAVAERATQQRHRLRQGAPAGPHRVEQGRRAWARSSSTPTSAAPCMTMKALTQAARAICLVTAARDGRRRAAPRTPAQRAAAAAPRGAADARSPRPSPPTSAARWPPSACRCTAAWASSRRPARRRSIAMRASCRSTRAPTASRPSTSSTRKLPLEGGKVVAGYIAELTQDGGGGARLQPARVRPHGRAARRGGRALAEASRWMGGALQKNPEAALAGATPYLRLFGLASGGIYLARGALAAARNGGQAQPIAIARFFAENIASAAPGLKETVIGGADSTLMLAAGGAVGVRLRNALVTSG